MLERVVLALRTLETAVEVLVVDDGSGDGTAALVAARAEVEPSLRLVRASHGGKAHALTTGARAARGRIVLFSDMDQAIPIDEAARLLPWFAHGFDVVIGSRGLERRHATLSRRAISFGQLVARFVVLGFAEITDTQCGFKAFRREVLLRLLDRLVVYPSAGTADERVVAGPALAPGFDVELLYVAKTLGLRVKEVPVECDHRRRGSEARLFRECTRGVLDLVAIRAAAIRGRYALAAAPGAGEASRSSAGADESPSRRGV